MGSITEIFYAISSAALIPTELALLAALAIVCVMIGRTLRDAVERARVAKSRKTLDHALEIADNPQSARDLIEAAAKEARRDLAVQFLATVLPKIDDEPFVVKKALDYQNAAKAYCERPERLARISPALGLMGTLIPLGPALVGLSQGDLETLSGGLVVAFSTTVVGLATAILAGFVAAARKRWARRDLALVSFAIERAQKIDKTIPEDDEEK